MATLLMHLIHLRPSLQIFRNKRTNKIVIMYALHVKSCFFFSRRHIKQQRLRRKIQYNGGLHKSILVVHHKLLNLMKVSPCCCCIIKYNNDEIRLMSYNTSLRILRTVSAHSLHLLIPTNIQLLLLQLSRNTTTTTTQKGVVFSVPSGYYSNATTHVYLHTNLAMKICGY